MDKSCNNPTPPPKETRLAVDETGAKSATYLDDLFTLTSGPLCTTSMEVDPKSPAEVAFNLLNGSRSRRGLPGALV